jgi:hypothetical protein
MGADSVLVGMRGGTAGDEVAIVGDMDGDGLADIVVADREYRATGDNDQRGAVHLVYGRPSFPARLDLSKSDAILEGDATAGDGDVYVAPAGDVNGDGLADLLVSWPHAVGCRGHPPVVFAAAYLVYGNRQRLVGRRRVGSTAARFDHLDPCAGPGSGLAGVGDLDRDGYEDFAIGLPGPQDGLPGGLGRVFLFYGRPQQIASGPLLKSASAILRGSPKGAIFGFVLAPGGDTDGDGHADFLIGETPGTTFLVRGAARRLAGEIDVSATAARFRALIDAPLFAGTVGDADGDGLSDLVLVDMKASFGGASARLF